MKITFNADQFKEAAKQFSNSEPFQMAILLIAEAHAEEGTSGSLTTHTFDGRRYTKVTMAAEVTTPGSCVLPLFYVQKIAETIYGQVRLSVLPSKALFRYDGPANEYASPIVIGNPEGLKIAAKPPLGSVTVELDEFKAMIRKIIFACGSDDPQTHRYESILFVCDETCVRAYAASMRVCATAAISKGSPYTGTFLLHNKALKSIFNLKGDLVTITFHGNGATFHTSGEITTELYIPETVGTLPMYEEEFSSKATTTLTGKRDDILAAIQCGRGATKELEIKMAYESGYIKNPPIFYGRDDGGSYAKHLAKQLLWTGNDRKVKVHADTFCKCIEGTQGTVNVDFCGQYGVILIYGEDQNFRAVTRPYSSAEER